MIYILSSIAGVFIFVSGYLLCYLTHKKPPETKEIYKPIQRPRTSFKSALQPVQTQEKERAQELYADKKTGLLAAIKPKGGDR